MSCLHDLVQTNHHCKPTIIAADAQFGIKSSKADALVLQKKSAPVSLHEHSRTEVLVTVPPV